MTIDSARLRNELEVLTRHLGRLLESGDRTRSEYPGAEAIAAGLGSAIEALGISLSETDAKMEQLVSKRPATAVASAFALGLAVGFLLRRP